MIEVQDVQANSENLHKAGSYLRNPWEFACASDAKRLRRDIE